ncbi:hypothetical protein G3I40_12440 [Streptomyces sp. SID14478]|uniref:hypothetical protein n=1 Tax=Streptomyces sp. SID14478 TaxID=2706073 RepID=UPI0013D8FCEC|nr:hypothetical protein [Streptomyces sp. SID14478]NEB76024.1 hypothetical protein [Streptomyces sp. SID14478]
MSSVAPASSSTDLDELTEHASALADCGRIRLVPHMLALPEQHTMSVRTLDSGTVSGAEFLDLASHVGSRFVYAEFDFLDAVTVLDESTGGAQREFTGDEASRWGVLRRRIQERDGRCAYARLAFTDGLALFSWSGEADWFGALAEEWGELVAGDDAASHHGADRGYAGCSLLQAVTCHVARRRMV